MNKKQKEQSKSSSMRSSRKTKWTEAENFSFNLSPSPVRKLPRRETLAGQKSAKTKKLSENVSSNRRKSIYLKRLETDFSEINEIPSPRRTRRGKSISNLKSSGEDKKMIISRTKSEKVIDDRKNMISSPTIIIHKLKRLDQINDKTNDAKQILEEKKPQRQYNKVKSKGSMKSKSETEINEEKLSTISKNKFYGSKKSTSGTVGVSSVVEKGRKKEISPGKKTSPSKSKSLTSLSKNNRNSTLSKKPVEKVTVVDPPQKKAGIKSSSKAKLQSVKKGKSSKNMDAALAVSSSPQLKKSVKRLQTAATPSPRKLSNKRMTRSSIRKKVHISAESPPASDHFRKTPRTHFKSSISPALNSKVNARKLKPFTPKPEEPLKILQQTMKKNVAAEMKAHSTSLLRTSVVTARTPLREGSSSRNKEISSPKKVTPPKKESPCYFNLPSTPVSSRKSVSTFRRYEGSVRLAKDSPDKSPSSPSSKYETKPLSSTPVKRKFRTLESGIGDDDLSDVSEFSSADDTQLTSYNSSCSIEDTVEESSMNSSNKLETETASAKKGYCTVM